MPVGSFTVFRSRDLSNAQNVRSPWTLRETRVFPSAVKAKKTQVPSFRRLPPDLFSDQFQRWMGASSPPQAPLPSTRVLLSAEKASRQVSCTPRFPSFLTVASCLPVAVSQSRTTLRN